MRRNYELSPSLICMDLCKIEQDVKRLEKLGCEVLHVDVLDGRFSPSMPIGLDIIRQLRKRTNLIFDAHLMTVYNEFFVNELIDIGCERICFRVEGEPSIGPLMQRIRSAGRQVGLALSPSTPVFTLEYAIEECDHVLLMRINPGYAGANGQVVKSYMERKLDALRELIEKRNPNVTITMDGRIGFQDLRSLYNQGVSTFVCGTGCLFRDDGTLEENWFKLHTLLSTDA